MRSVQYEIAPFLKILSSQRCVVSLNNSIHTRQLRTWYQNGTSRGMYDSTKILFLMKKKYSGIFGQIGSEFPRFMRLIKKEGRFKILESIIGDYNYCHV